MPELKTDPATDSLPTGTVTFLMTDIEGSTRMWETSPAEMSAALQKHDKILDLAISKNSGRLIKSKGEGDSVFAVFAKPTDAVAAAVDTLRRLAAEIWPQGANIRARVAVHSGEAEFRSGDYYGSAVNRCARLRGIAHGGQAIISESTFELVRDAMPELVGLRDLGRHRLKDLTRPERVFQLIHPDLQEDFPKLRSLDTRPHNLPVELTSFIGREHEMEEIKRLLAGTKLLTLTGTGGSGKTRLAYQVAAEALELHPDGVWIVELAPVFEPELVTQAVAGVFGLKQESHEKVAASYAEMQAAGPAVGTSLLDALLGHLREKDLLLVLDNCEHLIASAAQLTDRILRVCPQVKILATSREPLGVPGETPWRVPSLTMPDPRSISLDDLDQYEAVRLFIERATQAHSDFQVTKANAPAIAQICHRLDGIPLAIELAAARVKVLTPEQIAARLDDQFRLLTGGSRTALPRQQTLRALVDWSYQLLSDQEKLMLRRIGVFVGGLTLEAAEAVCADPSESQDTAIETFEVLDLISNLVDKSLVVAIPAAQTRYRLNETIRQYSREKLLESPEVSELRQRHSEWFTSLAEKACEELNGERYENAVELLDQDHDNLRQALQWSMTDANTDQALRLSASLRDFWMLRGYFSEGRDWLRQSLQLRGPHSQKARAKALIANARLDHVQGRHKSAMPLIDEAIELSRQTGEDPLTSEALRTKAALVSVTDRRKGLQAYEEALALVQSTDDRLGYVRSLREVGYTLAALNESEAAGQALEKAVSESQNLGNRVEVVRSLLLLAHFLQRNANKPDEATRVVTDALELAKAVNDRRAIADCLRQLSWLQIESPERAQALAEEALALYEEIGDLREMWKGNYRLGQAAVDENLRKRYYLRSLELARDLGDLWAEMYSLNNVGLTEEDPLEARKWYEQALKIGEELDDPHAVAMWYLNLSLTYETEGNHNRALELAEHALEQAKRLGEPSQIANYMRIVASHNFRAGNRERAMELLREGEATARETGAKYDRALGLNSFAWSTWEADEPEAGLEVAREAVDAAREAGEPSLLVASLHTLGEILLSLGEIEEARKLFTECVEHSMQLGASERAYYYDSLGYLEAMDGRLGEAAEALANGLNLKTVNDKWTLPDSLVNIARLAIALEKPSEAARLVGASIAVDRRAQAWQSLAVQKRVTLLTEELRERLGEVQFQEELESGGKLSVEDARKLALEITGRAE